MYGLSHTSVFKLSVQYTVYHCRHIPTAHAELCTVIVVFHIRKQISQCVMTCAVR